MNKEIKKNVVDKNDLRRLMKERAGTMGSSQNKIESPHAKYNAVGQLWCTLCNRHVKSNILWNAHLQSRTHRELIRIEAGASEVQPTILKRKACDTNEVLDPERKVMRMGCTDLPINNDSPANTSPSISVTFSEKTSAGLNDGRSPDDSSVRDNEPVASSSNIVVSPLPSDFFDIRVPDFGSSGNETIPSSLAEQLPEGFFDDPKVDAKVRQVPYKDKMDEEWELFQKSMKEETMISEALEEEDDELREVERNIEEIDDQLCRWSRVTDLLKKRELFTPGVADQHVGADDNCESDADGDFEEFADWRAGGK